MLLTGKIDRSHKVHIMQQELPRPVPLLDLQNGSVRTNVQATMKEHHSATIVRPEEQL